VLAVLLLLLLLLPMTALLFPSLRLQHLQISLSPRWKQACNASEQYIKQLQRQLQWPASCCCSEVSRQLLQQLQQ
jgi:hypothetical protein